MSKNYDLIKNYYVTGAWTKEMLQNTVGKASGITKDEYTEITGEVLETIPVTPVQSKVYGFDKILSGVLHPVTSDEPTTKVDFTIPDSMIENWAIGGLVKYEVFDGDVRIDAIPCFAFSMEGQKVMRVGFRTSGTEDKSFTRINGALLLQRR